MGTFVADLAHGEDGEKEMVRLLHQAFPECTFIKANKTSKYMDLLCTEHGEAVEVKTDRKAGETGNVCFEWKLFEHTRAQRVCYLIGSRAYCWDVQALKDELLRLHAHNLTRGVFGGDRWANPLILAPTELITESATTYEIGGER